MVIEGTFKVSDTTCINNTLTNKDSCDFPYFGWEETFLRKKDAPLRIFFFHTDLPFRNCYSLTVLKLVIFSWNNKDVVVWCITVILNEDVEHRRQWLSPLQAHGVNVARKIL